MVAGQRHPELGDVREALAGMVKQRQLFEGKSTGADGMEVRFYEWGEQAEHHVEKESLDKWIYNLCGVTQRPPLVVVKHE